MYAREIKEKQIFKRIRWQLRIFESVFYKSLIRACSIGNSLAASQNARSDGQTSNHIHLKSIQTTIQCVCFNCIGIYNKHLSVITKIEN